MNKIQKPKLDLHGTIELEGSKSILQRLILISLFLKDELRVTNWSSSNDVTEMSKAVGVESTEKDVLLSVSCLQDTIHIDESATALRFLVTYASLNEGKKTSITMGKRLAKRPHDILFDLLRKLGAAIDVIDCRIDIVGSKPTLKSIDVPANVSSQYISALLLCAPLFENGLTFKLIPPIVSKNYIELTIALMTTFGITVSYEENVITIPPKSNYKDINNFTCEADLSSAIYPLCVGLFSEKGIGVTPISNHTKQPDFVFWKLLSDAGADIKLHYREDSEEAVLISKLTDYDGFTFDAMRAPDLVPALALLALFADTESMITNVDYLKNKESNRVVGIVNNFKLLGADIEYNDSTLTIQPLSDNPNSVTLDTQNDHRLAMVFYIITLMFPQVSINERDSIGKSYPHFIDDIANLK